VISRSSRAPKLERFDDVGTHGREALQTAEAADYPPRLLKLWRGSPACHSPREISTKPSAWSRTRGRHAAHPGGPALRSPLPPFSSGARSPSGPALRAVLSRLNSSASVRRLDSAGAPKYAPGSIVSNHPRGSRSASSSTGSCAHFERSSRAAQRVVLGRRAQDHGADPKTTGLPVIAGEAGTGSGSRSTISGGADIRVPESRRSARHRAHCLLDYSAALELDPTNDHHSGNSSPRQQ